MIQVSEVYPLFQDYYDIIVPSSNTWHCKNISLFHYFMRMILCVSKFPTIT